ncbi:NADH dehydrogenase (ubiquinone) 1 alpha subcomplex subunit 12 [Azospirillaceae bacterium]
MSEKISFISWMANFQVNWFTFRRGQLVGEDQFGNRYYIEKKKTPSLPRRRRWVIYNGEPEATKVPPEWHGWLHYTHDEPIPLKSEFHQSWVKPHQANRSGSLQAHKPPGFALGSAERSKATGDYQSWTPN